MNWDNERILKLINEYKKRPILWRKDQRFNFHIVKKEEAWQELSDIFEEEIDVVKKKIESLRGSRRREKNRMLKSMRTGKDSVTEIEREVEEETSGLMEDRISSIMIGPVSKPTLVATSEMNATYPGAGLAETGGVVVRAEEALIVILVLVLWVAAIALFFNRWGKIRMLEPYQPKFQQQHRQSCAMIDANPLPHRTCSKFNIHCLEHPVVYPAGYGSSISRPRQNSVFVGSSVSLLPPQNTPRRAKSAFDLQTLIVAECGLTNSHVNGLDLDRSRRGRDFSKLMTDSVRLGALELQNFTRTPTPMQRQRGMSICHFDRTDVLARPLIRERGMSICQFDRGENSSKYSPRERGTSICQFDRQMPSCSKTPDVVHSYRATCV